MSDTIMWNFCNFYALTVYRCNIENQEINLTFPCLHILTICFIHELIIGKKYKKIIQTYRYTEQRTAYWHNHNPKPILYNYKLHKD